MTDWRIYYDNGDTFDNADGTPEDAPPFGVLCIVFACKVNGRMVMHGWDWYFYNEQEKNWWGADIHGLLDQLMWNKPVRAVKQGRNTTETNWHDTMNRAMNDPDFPIKSSYSKRERPFQVY